jgi:3-oxoacyl-[acyl-carrier protein] reductase
MFDLTGKTALVTGGSRGLGRAIALALAGQGADVAVNYRGNADAAEEAAQQVADMGRRSITIQGDTSEGRDACEAIVKAALDGLGSIDILVNNAGITRDNLLMRMDADEWDAVIDTNLSGPFWMTRAIARPMLKARSGRIINMSSAAGRMGNAGQANYAAAKAGVINMTRAMAVQLAPYKIRVNCVVPNRSGSPVGYDDDVAGSRTFENLAGRLGTPEDQAKAALFLVSDDSEFIIGHPLVVDGGVMATANFPKEQFQK